LGKTCWQTIVPVGKAWEKNIHPSHNRGARRMVGRMSGTKLIAALCPRCGASLDFPEGMEKAHCMYCGTLIMIGKAAEASRMVECTVCDGLGRIDRCRACDGSGICTWSTRGAGNKESILTIGFSSSCEDGICSACRGSGRYMLSSCPACNGSGRCPACHGSGKCPACRGVGFMPNPNGGETCSSCGGKGMRILDDRSAPATPKVCPSCNQPLGLGWTRCPNCGLKVGTKPP